MEEDKNNRNYGLKQGHKIEEFPIAQTERSCTDVFCAVVGIFYTLTLIVTAFIVFNGDHYMRTSFPSDSQGRVCGYDLRNHPYIYFTRFPSIKDRVCVQQCPKAGDTRLNCVPTDDIGCAFSNNPNFTVSFLQSTPEELEIGSYCVPEEPALKAQLYEDIDVTNRYHFFQQIKSIAVCALVALGLAILYLCAVQWLPKLMNLLTIILGLLFVGIMALFVIFYPSGNAGIRVAFAVVVVLLMVIVGYGAFKSKACFDMHGVFLSAATQLLKEDLRMLLFIPLFLAIFILFVLIVIWELKSLWSSSSIFFTPESVYYQFSPGSTTLLTCVTMFQFVWGLSFIKESFNFCISGKAVQWYEGEKQDNSILTPLKYLVRYHFGSVVAASFINVVFSLFDYIFDVLRADTNSDAPRHSFLSAMDSIFDLVRSDSLAFINLSGNPYCNSSRYCEALCRRSPIAEYSQSISRSYRICSHFFLAGLVATLSFFLQGTASVFIVMVVFVISLFVSTFFISLHADAAEAIQIVFLLDIQLARQKQKDPSKHKIPHLPLRNKTIASEYHKESQQLRLKLQDKK